MNKATALLALAFAATAAQAQINAGDQKPEATLPFTVTKVATMNLPWRIAFLPTAACSSRRRTARSGC